METPFMQAGRVLVYSNLQLLMQMRLDVEKERTDFDESRKRLKLFKKGGGESIIAAMFTNPMQTDHLTLSHGVMSNKTTHLEKVS